MARLQGEPAVRAGVSDLDIDLTDREMVKWKGQRVVLSSNRSIVAASTLLVGSDQPKILFASKATVGTGQCADRYGGSLIAAVLQWLQFTGEKAMLVVSRDGFVDWAWSSEPAHGAGAFIASRRDIVEVQRGTLAADDAICLEREGRDVSACAWLKHAEKGLAAREMKVQMDQLDYILSLIVIPKMADFWLPFRGRSDD